MGGKAKSAISGASGRGKRKQSVVSADEDEEGGEEMAVEMAAGTQEERQKEIEHRAMLVRALDDDQMKRYEAWRSVKLPDATVRRVGSSLKHAVGRLMITDCEPDTLSIRTCERHPSRQIRRKDLCRRNDRRGQESPERVDCCR